MKYKKRIDSPAITAGQNRQCWAVLSAWLDMQQGSGGTIEQMKVVVTPNPGFIAYAINNNWLLAVDEA